MHLKPVSQMPRPPVDKKPHGEPMGPPCIDTQVLDAPLQMAETTQSCVTVSHAAPSATRSMHTASLHTSVAWHGWAVSQARPRSTYGVHFPAPHARPSAQCALVPQLPPGPTRSAHAPQPAPTS